MESLNDFTSETTWHVFTKFPMTFDSIEERHFVQMVMLRSPRWLRYWTASHFFLINSLFRASNKPCHCIKYRYDEGSLYYQLAHLSYTDLWTGSFYQHLTIKALQALYYTQPLHLRQASVITLIKIKSKERCIEFFLNIINIGACACVHFE